jgi:predicted GNAT family N-acyltransferase/RimJ/RimL family protein N-acetyltransferase
VTGGYRAEPVTDPVVAAQAVALRQRVFVDGQGVPAGLEYDGLDETADHVVVRDAAGVVVATGRVLAEGGRARLGRICSAPEVRGTGAGAALLAGLERAALLRGLPRGVLHAQRGAAGFYARAGWTATGEPDVEAGIEHVWMTKDLLPGLREATDADADGLQRLIGACWSEYPNCILDVDAEEPWLRAPATAVAGYGGALWVVAPEGGPLLASVAVRPATPGDRVTAELKSLYVGAPARRHGWGAALVGLARRWAADAGFVAVELWTDSRFADAHRLYERLGFTFTGGSRELHDLSGTTEFHATAPPLPGRAWRWPDPVPA